MQQLQRYQSEPWSFQPLATAAVKELALSSQCAESACDADAEGTCCSSQASTADPLEAAVCVEAWPIRGVSHHAPELPEGLCETAAGASAQLAVTMAVGVCGDPTAEQSASSWNGAVCESREAAIAQRSPSPACRATAAQVASNSTCCPPLHWQPQALPSCPPRLAAVSLTDVFDYVERSLLRFGDMVIKTETQPYNRGWSVRAFVKKGVLRKPQLSAFLLGKAQEALLAMAGGYSEVFLLGYKSQPFTLLQEGHSPSFGAALVKVTDPSAACWDLLKAGFCPRSGCCGKRHPDPVEVKVMLRRARFGQKILELPRARSAGGRRP